MNDLEREVLETSMTWMDGLWDDGTSLLYRVRRDRHMVRETAWYALGLLQRDGERDQARAERALRTVLANQFDLPDAPFDGTFRRAPEEPDPPDEPVMWAHYDPNWRQFIGTTFAVIVDRYANVLPDPLTDDLRASIERCVAGEPDDRVAPTYANIALMKAWLDNWAGRVESAEAFAREIHGHFDAHGCFLEYNSPTYYGIDLWALALWRSTDGPLHRHGADMEQRLWRDIARFYHAGLRNLCGPYDRAYGMDMTAHATPLGLHVWSAVGRARAPFPDTSGRFSHPHDCCFGPLVGAVPTVVPTDVVPHLEGFRGERGIEQVVSDDPERVVTAWLGEDAMIGAWSGPSSGISIGQAQRATAHTPDGWIRLRPETPADARVDEGRLTITGEGSIELEIDGEPDVRIHGEASTSAVERGRRILTFDRRVDVEASRRHSAR
jgi:hypothetical protein